MDRHLARVEVLMGQSRFDMAKRELSGILADDPDAPLPHIYMAMCCAELKEYENALDAAKRGVGLAPDFPLAHYALSEVHLRRKKPKEALAAAMEALRLDPNDVAIYTQLARIYLFHSDWRSVENYARRGLALEAENVPCLNLLSLALTNQGKKDEAAATIQTTLAKAPENALARANSGWAALHRGEPDLALTHFREALRLDPDMDYARSGAIEALRARYLVYRLVLKYFLYMARLSGKGQWLVILGIYFFMRSLPTLKANYPQGTLLFNIAIGLSIVFVYLTWTAPTLFDTLVAMHPVGRLTLKPPQKKMAFLAGALLTGGIAAILAALFAVPGVAGLRCLMSGVLAIVIVIPAASTFRFPPGAARNFLAVATLVLLGIGITAIAAVGTPLGISMTSNFFIGVFIFTIVANLAASAQR